MEADAPAPTSSPPVGVWIGERPSASAVAAFMFCGVTGLMIAGLLPLLLGSLADDGRIAATALGQVATAELLSMGLTAGIAGALLKAERLKLIALIALCALAAADLATPFARGAQLIWLRGAAGVPNGVLVWITIALIARTPTPERWAAVYLTAQTLGQFVMAALLAAWVMPRFGADGGFGALACLCGINAAAVFWLPRSLAPLPDGFGVGLPNARGAAALCVSIFFLAASSGVWVYVGRLSHQAGHTQAAAGLAVSASLAFQVAGGLVATLLAGRVSWFMTLVACAALDVATFGALSLLPGATAFAALAAIMGFIWIFATPFLVPLTIDADPSRRAALLIGGAQLIGGSLGPLFASFFVSETDVRGALAFASVCIAVGVAIVIALHATRSNVPAA